MIGPRGGARARIFSGRSDDASETHDPLGPASDLLAKPFSPAQLTERVRALLQAEVRA